MSELGPSRPSCPCCTFRTDHRPTPDRCGLDARCITLFGVITANSAAFFLGKSSRGTVAERLDEVIG